MTKGANAVGSYACGGRYAISPDAISRPDILSMATVLGTIKAKPDGSRLELAGPARDGGYALRSGQKKACARSNKRNMIDPKFVLASWATIREPAAFRK